MRLLPILLLLACAPTPVDNLPLPGAWHPDAAAETLPAADDAATGTHCGLPVGWVLGSWGDCDGHPGCAYRCIAQQDPDTGSRLRVAACTLDGEFCTGQFVDSCAACP